MNKTFYFSTLVLAAAVSGFSCASPRLRAPAMETAMPGFHNSAESTPILGMISDARKTIDIEIYTMTDKRLRLALRDAMSKKVRIRIIKDPSPVEETCPLFSAILTYSRRQRGAIATTVS